MVGPESAVTRVPSRYGRLLSTETWFSPSPVLLLSQGHATRSHIAQPASSTHQPGPTLGPCPSSQAPCGEARMTRLAHTAQGRPPFRAWPCAPGPGSAPCSSASGSWAARAQVCPGSHLGSCGSSASLWKGPYSLLCAGPGKTMTRDPRGPVTPLFFPPRAPRPPPLAGPHPHTCLCHRKVRPSQFRPCGKGPLRSVQLETEVTSPSGTRALPVCKPEG